MTQEESQEGESHLDDIGERFLDEIEAGGNPDLAALCEAHPQLGDELKRRLSTIDLLIRVGRETRSAPTETEPSIRCPHCGHGMELPHAGGVLSCPECGSSFRVDAPAPAADSSQDAPERIGRFHVLVPLGRGAFGTVYQAHDTDLDRMVAIKVPRVGLFQTREDAERFLREARSAAQLRHPGIVQVHEIGYERGVPYIVSDYIESHTLAELIGTDRPSFHESAALVARIADAIEYAHGHKIIHRDVKPQNILLDPSGNPHVSDFGLARREGEEEVTVTMDGQILGTPAYMSPEQAAGDHARVNARSDVYSLGVVLYELLSGERPFRGSRSRVIYQVIHDEPRAPRSLNDHIPRDLDTVCMKAMAKEPSRRYASAADFAEDLRRFLRGESVLARPVSRTERFWRWTRRNRRLTAALLSLFIILVTGLGVSLVLLRRVSEETRAKGEALQGKDHALTTLQAALERAEGLRLTALSSNVLSSDPALALLLAIEGTQRHADLAARNAVLDALSGLRELRTLRGHGGAVLSVTFSPDGRLVATSSADGDARVWNAADGTAVAILKGHVHEMPVVTFSGDGRAILTASIDGSLRLWNAATMERIAAFPLWRRTASVAPSQNGERVLVVAGGAAIWDVAGRRQVAAFPGEDGEIACAAFNRDETRVAVGTRTGIIRVHDSSSGRPIAVLTGHRGELKWVSFVPPSRSGADRLASFAADGSARLWDVAASSCLRVLDGPPTIETAVLSPDGRLLAAFSGGPASVLDLETGARVCALVGQDGPAACAAFSLDARKLAGVSLHQDKTIHIWDAEGGRQLAALDGHKQSIRAVSFSPDGKSIASASLDGTARLWLVAREAEPIVLRGHSGRVSSAAFSSDGGKIVTASQDGTAGIWDAGTGKLLLTLEASGSVNAAAFDADGSRVVTAGESGIARVWDTSTGGELAVLRGHVGPVLAAVFNTDGERVVTGSADRTIRIWDVANAREMLMLPPLESPVRSIVLSADGHWLVSRVDRGPARLWSATTGAEEATLRHVLVRTVECAAFSRDGQRIVTASGDKTARIWEGSSGKQVAILRGHGGAISSAAFDAAGRRVVTASADRTARIWDGEAQRAVLVGHHGEVNHAAFSPDGARVVTGSKDRTARVWNAETGHEEITLRHDTEVIAVAFSPDGRRVLSVPADGPPCLWTVDVLGAARERKPRALTPEELDLYYIGSPEERRSYGLDMDIADHRMVQDLLERRTRTEPSMWPAPWEHMDSLFALIHLLSRGASDKHVSSSIELADWWVARTGRKEPRALAALAELKVLAGRTDGAILALEEAVRLPSMQSSLKVRLADLRRASLPDLLTYASIDAFLEEREWNVLVPAGAIWRFFPGRSEPSRDLEWTQGSFDDSSWEDGPSGLGYGDDDDATVLEGMMGSYGTLYARHRFRVDGLDHHKRFLLSILADDGFVAYLNGVEVGRENAEPLGSPLPHDALANAEGSEGQPSDLWVGRERFREGENILAVQGLNAALDNSDFSLLPVLASELVPNPEKEQQVLAAFRAAARAKGAHHRLAYVEGKLLAMAGDHRRAATRFADASRLEKARSEPALGLAQSLRAAGDLVAAEAAVRRALEAGLAPADDVWDLWFTLNVLDLKRPPEEALRAMPSAGASAGAGERGADLRWALEEISSRGALRINCGGPEHRSREGAVWGRDRFFMSGYRFTGDRRLGGALEPFRGEIAGTDDDPLYQTERWFPSHEPVKSHYHVPLPPGRYRVTLHFAEIFLHEPSVRTFDVVAEGATALEAYEPGRTGFAVADRRSFEADVTDGFLDLLFVERMDLPKISAIEVERVATR